MALRAVRVPAAERGRFNLDYVCMYLCMYAYVMYVTARALRAIAH